MFAFSFPALCVGPFYYMYLGMRRRGIAIIGFFLVAVGVNMLLEATTHASFGAAIIPITLLFCACSAKKDYYRTVIVGDRFWQPLRPLESTGALIALCVIPIALAGIIAEKTEHKNSPSGGAATVTQANSMTAVQEAAPKQALSADELKAMSALAVQVA